MPLYRTEAIVLRSEDFRESDKLLTLYTERQGKLHALVRASRKQGNRWGACFEPLLLLDLLLHQGNTSRLPLVTEAEVKEVYDFGEDLPNWCRANYLAELTAELSPLQEPEPRLFHLLRETFSTLLRKKEMVEMTLRLFELKVLKLSGFFPSLERCVACGRKIGEGSFKFSSRLGGVLGSECKGKDTRAISLTRRERGYLKALGRMNFQRLSRLKISPQSSRELEAILRDYIENLLEKELNSPKILRSLEPGVFLPRKKEEEVSPAGKKRPWPSPLSYSLISAYLECPLRCKLVYFLGLKEKPKYYFSFGKTMHRVAEFFFRAHKDKPPSLGELLQFLTENWDSSGYTSPSHEGKFLRSAREITRAFWRVQSKDFRRPLALEHLFRCKLEDIPLKGIIDRIDRVNGRGLEIIDYKTNFHPFSLEEVRKNKQLTLYQMACEATFDRPVERLTLYHLRSQTSFRTPPRTGREKASLLDEIISVKENIDQGNFAPRKNKFCPCDFPQLCPYFRDKTAKKKGA